MPLYDWRITYWPSLPVPETLPFRVIKAPTAADALAMHAVMEATKASYLTSAGPRPGSVTSIEALAESKDTAQAALEDAGFRVVPDLHGKPTIWCCECGRDSGFHVPRCSKAKS